MSEHPPHSGSRWEPGAGEPAETTRPIPEVGVPSTVDIAPATPETAIDTTDTTRSRRWTRHGRRAPLAAAAAVGLVAAAGTGGFAIGHEVGQHQPDSPSPSGDGRDGQQPGTPMDGRRFGDRDDDGRGRPGSGPGDSDATSGAGRQTTYRVPPRDATGSHA